MKHVMCVCVCALRVENRVSVYEKLTGTLSKVLASALRASEHLSMLSPSRKDEKLMKNNS